MTTTLARRAFGLVSILLLASASRGLAQTDTAALQRLLTSEDARGTGPDGMAPLLDGLRSDDSLMRRVAARAVGRLQKPELAPMLTPLLGDPVPAVRAEAASAIAQALWRARRAIAGGDSSQLIVRAVQQPLFSALAAEPDDAAAATIAEAAGRLHYADSNAARRAERSILVRTAANPSFGAVAGLYWLALARRATGPLGAEAIAVLRQAARMAPDTLLRRVAILALATNASLDSATIRVAFADPDAQVRRRALMSAPTLPAAERAAMIQRALTDSSAMVRVAIPGALRSGQQVPDCAPLVQLLSDRNAWVALSATDSIGSACTNREAVAAALAAVVAHPLPESVPDHRWQRPAHALVALASADSSRARALLPRFVSSRMWQERIYAALAAARLRDTALLRRLAGDADHNAAEAAIAGLRATAGHAADDVYVAALRSSGSQVVLAAALALAGTHDSSVVPALLHSFDSISATRRENARDPRLELLKRIGELGSPAILPRLTPYLADFYTSIAGVVASIVSRLSGSTVIAAAQPFPIPHSPLAGTLLAREIRVRFTMARSSGGGSFTVRMFGDDATATVARLLAMVRAGFYAGHRFQRVEPGFVVQGGGPDASEYVGAGAFIRDELSNRGNFRGTAAMSSRGRDTGDGQWYFNLVDNTRLDHEYTVFGVVTEGMDVVERILEEDIIARVEVVP
jgi:cyclophilin family peptidyl-prolyl cis-trans isomerase/HEAT repeat protein